MPALSTYLPEVDALRRRGKLNAPAAFASLEEIIERGQKIAAAVAAYRAKEADLIAVPFFEVIITTDLIEEFIELYFADLDYPPELFLALRAAEEGLFSLQTLRLTFASQASATAGVAADVFVPGPGPLVPYRVRQGDTLERIALNFLGSTDRSWEIIDLNQLVYPFLITDETAPRYATQFTEEFDPTEFQIGRLSIPGIGVTRDILMLPGDALVTGPALERSELDVELFGRDYSAPYGRLARGEDGDFETVESEQNVIQALRKRVGTFRGEIVYYPGYGIDQLLAIGVEGTRSNVIVSGVSVARCVYQDPRVVSVQNLEILFADTINRALMTVKLIGPSQREIPLNLVVPETIQRAPGIQ